jgi:hypothetical protein
MFKFKEENRAENIKIVSQKLNALVEKIDVLKSMEVGIDINRGERAFDLSLYSTFENKGDLKTYAKHPEHLKVLAFIKKVIQETKVVDYMI